MKDHWLFLKCEFEKEIKKETDCTNCLHRQVCNLNMSERCINYHWGDSRYKHCEACSHHFTRYDKKQPIPCFCCKDFLVIQVVY